MSISKTKAYWIIQIGVWSLLNSALLLGYWFGGNGLEVTFWQALLDFSTYCVISIILSHVMKLLINKYCIIDNFKWIDILKTIGFIIGAATFTFLIYNLYVQLMYRYVYERLDVFDHPSQSLTFQIIFYFNTMIYFIAWTIIYMAIKGVMELNKSRQDRLQLESNLKESQLNTLKGQINPHFMFNTLNNIRGLMLEDVNRSREMLTRLSEMLRNSLTSSSTDAIPLEEELEMVENFVSISKIQFEDRLNFSQQIDPSLMKKPIPPMIIQLLVENATKHGISRLKEGGKVSLEVLKEDNMFVIRVTNSGKLIINEKSTKLGLENIKKRLNLIYGSDASFSLNEVDNNVVAEIKMP